MLLRISWNNCFWWFLSSSFSCPSVSVFSNNESVDNWKRLESSSETKHYYASGKQAIEISTIRKKGISFLYLTKCFRICFPESWVKPVNGFDQEVKMYTQYLTQHSNSLCKFISRSKVKLEVKRNTIKHFKMDKIRIMRGHFLQLIEICWHQYQVIKADLFLFSEGFFVVVDSKSETSQKGCGEWYTIFCFVFLWKTS